ANRIKKDPERSILKGNPFPKNPKEAEGLGQQDMKLKHILVLLALAGGIGAYVTGVFVAEWSLGEMSAVFLVIMVATALIGRIHV
ncbi:YfcC family protein, partial [Salinicoccus roseus]|nr:YfcC family protein [Salinicoccus roseus]MBY8911117.1 YfcC family protein [Salinicoccus roseus]